MPKVDDRLRKWTDGKPAGLVGFALAMVSSASEIQWALEVLRTAKFTARIPPPPPAKVLLSFYRHHRRMDNFIGARFGFDLSGPESASGIAKQMRAFDRMPIETKKAIVEELKKLPPEKMKEINDLRLGIINDSIDEARTHALDEEKYDDAEMKQLMATPEMHYLLWVWLPCWIEYREFPGKLFSRARHGDIDALEKLLRIDKSVLLEPRIAQHVHQAFWIKGRARLKKLAAAIGGVPHGPVTKAKIKRGLAGLISRMAVKLKHPLTEPEIRELFNAIASMKGGLIDRELPHSSEAFAKAIQREKLRWPGL